MELVNVRLSDCIELKRIIEHNLFQVDIVDLNMIWFNFTLTIYIFLHILKLNGANFGNISEYSTNLSLYSYHPSDPDGSKKIASFEYEHDIDYQVAPIWDCKVALVPENSSTKEVVTFDFASSEIKVEHTLMKSRSGFATLLVGMKLYVCGGLNMTSIACEVWLKSTSEFIDSGHEWLTIRSSGPRSGLTLHPFDNWLCAFGGRKLKEKDETTKQVTCFDTTGTATVDLANDCQTDQYRENHASILYDANTVILCGGQHHGYNTCDILKVTGQHKSCLGSKPTIHWELMRSSLLRWSDDVLALGAVIDFEFDQINFNLWRTHVSRPFDGVLGLLEEKPSYLRHSVSDIRLFNVPSSCKPPDHSNEEAIATVQPISVPGCQDACGSLIPYHAALAAFGFTCIMLLAFLVYTARNGNIVLKLTKDDTRTGSGAISDLAQQSGSRTMSDHNMPNNNKFHDSHLAVTSESMQEEDISITVPAKSKIVTTVMSNEALYFPAVSKSNSTQGVHLIGSIDVSSCTAIKGRFN